MKDNNIKQKLSNNKGITLVSLLITIVVMVILVGVSVNVGTESLDSTRLQGFYMQLETIQKRVDDIVITKESYIDSEGNAVYLREQGTAYEDLTASQQTLLQNIISSEGSELNLDVSTFKYFTIEQLESILDLSDIEYNVFIDFNTRTIIAEQGITINGESYHILKSSTYFVDYNIGKNEGSILYLTYNVTTYGTDRYKVAVTPGNTVGDLNTSGTLRYKTTTTKYWETSTNLEMIIDAGVSYEIEYTDSNNNIAYDKITVSTDDTGNIEINNINYWNQNKTKVSKRNSDGTITYLQVGDSVTLKADGDSTSVAYSVDGYTGEWVVLGAENGKLLLLSKTNVSENIITSATDGYLNGVTQLNKACAVYKNEKYADEARSIKLEDMNRITGYDPATADSGSTSISAYGNVVTYTKNSEGYIEYKDLNGNSGTSTYQSFTIPGGTDLAIGESVSIKSTEYYYYFSNDGTTVSTDLWSMLFGTRFWMANQIQLTDAGYVVYGLGASWSDVGYQPLLDTTGVTISSDGMSLYGVRAVVSIKPEVQVTKVD